MCFYEDSSLDEKKNNREPLMVLHDIHIYIANDEDDDYDNDDGDVEWTK